jgi:hypothetical protein
MAQDYKGYQIPEYLEMADAVIAFEAEQDAARQAAIDHAKSLGFTDAMIAVMYPNLSKKE